MVTVPPSGVSSVAKIESNVVLPAPLGPSTPKIAPRGTALDLWPNEFFTEDGQSLICATHGAVYEPDSGRCTAGPCLGDALIRLPLRREGDAIVVSCPRE